LCIDLARSWIWCQDVADFADQVSGKRAWRRLARAIQGRGLLPPVQSRVAWAVPAPDAGLVVSGATAGPLRGLGSAAVANAARRRGVLLGLLAAGTLQRVCGRAGRVLGVQDGGGYLLSDQGLVLAEHDLHRPLLRGTLPLQE
jgi:hypothetical protein